MYLTDRGDGFCDYYPIINPVNIKSLTYQDAIDFLFNQLPMYQRVGKKAYNPSLDGVLELLSFLGNPHKALKCIHVAGTNGKGSVCHMLSAVYQKAGQKTGLYSSPHLIDFSERIKINATPIPPEKVIAFVGILKPQLEHFSKPPSFFEMSVAMAFWYFNEEKTDIAIIETGLGGRLDSTNVISPILSIITNIGFDHTDVLGNTLAKIAYEKAGIIKANTPVLVGKTQKKTTPVFKKVAQQKKAPLHFVLTSQNKETLVDYNEENKNTAKQAIAILQDLGEPVSRQASLAALEHYKTISHFKGRWDVVCKKPITILECAHNPNGLTKALARLSGYSFDTLHIVYGVVKDKDVHSCLACLPKQAKYYLTKPNVIRGLDAEILLEKAEAYQLKSKVFKNVKQAILAAQKSAEQTDLILITGSIFVVGEAYESVFNSHF